jgi:hypothetical protein
MKNIALAVWNHLKKNSSMYFWSFWAGLSFWNITTLCVKISERQSAELRAARQETVELRDKINNHLIAEGFYNKPAKEVLPVMKEFGIEL